MLKACSIELEIKFILILLSETTSLFAINPLSFTIITQCNLVLINDGRQF
ncbi:hypothetical protein SAMN04488136_10994 [Vibrio xiamenensis]|uniref:Uncharacterized protein n=1 Tax=Vibrio xiamenensis TaxID=861298 RepID=A0A1G8A1X0_9VIBR|nr:hypothetical protein SAMN04488136_10994 [Vibrio xiamenensis]